MASILHRGANQYRPQFRRNGANLGKTFETRRDAEEWARVSEGKMTGGEPVQKRPIATLAEDEGVGPDAVFGPQTAIHRLNARSKIVQTWNCAHKAAVEDPVKPGG